MTDRAAHEQRSASAEWRRLRFAAVFFVICLAVVATMLVVGAYH